MDGCWMDGWMDVGWMVGESGIKANSAQFSWSLAELGNKNDNVCNYFTLDDMQVMKVLIFLKCYVG